MFACAGITRRESACGELLYVLEALADERW
jgi:hypothetical protein